MIHSKRAMLASVSLALAISACGAPSESDHGDALQDETPAAEADSLRRNALSPSQAQQTLRLIDNICGDTWCEGDYDFSFHCLVCDAASGRCTLRFEMLPRDDAPNRPKSYAERCTTTGFTGFDSLVDTTENGYQSLQSDYYSALTDCIADIEASLR